VVETSLIQVPSDLGALGQVLAWFDQRRPSSISQPLWLQCQLALAEGFTNAVRHAHQDRSPDTLITIEIQVLEQHLEIRVWDFGAVFDLQKKLRSLSQEIDKNAVGGRGLHLIQQIADDLSYIRTTDDRNCLLIRKNF
jgi:serine/threonine-protein kinase RsbW